jgi:hypothetical protein
MAAFGLIALLLLPLQCRPVAAQAGDPLLVVINPRNLAGAALNLAEVKNILLGSKATWPSGDQIALILGPPGDNDRAEVMKDIGGINESVFTRRQLQASFTGGTPVVVREVKSAPEVKAALKTSPLAVGFLHKNEVDSSVKVLFAVQ